VEEDRGSPLFWVVALTLLITFGGWAIRSLVVELTKDENPEQVLTSSKPDADPSESSPSAEEEAPPDEPMIGLPQVALDSLDERLEPTKGQLFISSNVVSRVSIVPISGEAGSRTTTMIGSTPINAHYLPDGVYEVKLVALSTGRAKRTRVRIDAGEVSRVELNF
jgi:hypothetical protein